MSDRYVLCVIVNRDKMTDYERKRLKEVNESIRRHIVPMVLRTFKDVGVRPEDINVILWNNNANLIIEIENNAFNLEDRVHDNFILLKDQLLEEYRTAFVETPMKENIIMVCGNRSADDQIVTVEYIELRKDNVSGLGNMLLMHISDDRIKEALAYLKDLLQHQSFESIKIEDIDQFEDSLRIYTKRGREKLLRIIKLSFDMSESTPSKIVIALESQHPRHLRAFKKELENLLLSKPNYGY